MTLEKTIYLRADKAKVWAYLTEPEKLATWFHKPKTTLSQGNAYAMFGTETGDKLMWGDVISARPHHFLEYTFAIAPMGDTVSKVAFTLEDVPGGTRLKLSHTGLPEGEKAFGLTLALDNGWDGHFIKLRKELHDEG